MEPNPQETKIISLKKSISLLQWDISMMVNEETKKRKEEQLVKLQKELTILNSAK